MQAQLLQGVVAAFTNAFPDWRTMNLHFKQFVKIDV